MCELGGESDMGNRHVIQNNVKSQTPFSESVADKARNLVQTRISITGRNGITIYVRFRVV